MGQEHWQLGQGVYPSVSVIGEEGTAEQGEEATLDVSELEKGCGSAPIDAFGGAWRLFFGACGFAGFAGSSTSCLDFHPPHH